MIRRLFARLRAWLLTEPCCEFANRTHDEGCDGC